MPLAAPADRPRPAFRLRAVPFELVPLVAMPLVFALPFFLGQSLLFRDLVHFDVPEQVLSARALLDGRLPQWNPFLYGGTPFLAEPGTGVFYPPNWLFLILDPWRAATAFVLLHLPIAAWGTLALGRRLGLSRVARTVAACGFTGSGYLLSMSGGHYYFASAALLPLAVALLLEAADLRRTRPVAKAALGVALLLFNGELQAALFAVFFAAALAVAPPPGPDPVAAAAGPARRESATKWLQMLSVRALAMAGAVTLGAALGAVQLVPSLMLGLQTIRAHGMVLAQAAEWALHPLRLLDFVVPQPWGMPYPDNGFFGRGLVDGAHGVPWAPSLWLGTLLPLLALSTPRQRVGGRRAALVAVALTSLLCALGTRTPLFALAHAFAPLVDRFRYPEKFALPATLAIALLGAMRLDDLSAAGAERARRAVSRLLLAATAIFVALLAVASLHPPTLLEAISRGLREAEANVLASAALRTLQGALLESALLCAAGALACAAEERRRGLLPAIVLLAIGAALTGNGLDVLAYGGAGPLRHEPAIARALRSTLPPGAAGRVFSDGGCRFDGQGSGSLLERVRAFQWETGRENLLSLFGLRAAIGYGAVEDPEQVAIFRALSRLSPDAGPRAFGAAVRFGCAAGGPLRIEPISNPLARVRVARPLALPDAEDARARALIGEAEDGYAATLVAPEELARIPAPGAAGSAAVLSETPEELAVEVEGGGGVLVLADRFSAGWSARLDGAAVPLFRADVIWRGVAVPPGAHQLQFSYRTPGLITGCALSIAAALLLLVLAACRRDDRSAEAPTAPRAAA